MMKSRFTEAQIIRMIKEQEARLPTAELCRKHGLSPATFYKLKAKYGGMDLSDAKHLKQLEDENAIDRHHACVVGLGLGVGWHAVIFAHGLRPGIVGGKGMDGTGHDEVNMPGLRGENASPEESAELAVMFRNFETFTREVTNLPNGIRTVTRSSDPEVMANLVSHVTGMIGRVGNLDDPKIFIQSPTLDIFFQRGDKITSEIEVTDEGIVVVQTSTDPEVVTALQVHAAEVSDVAARGMQAVHEKMMQQGG